MSKTLEELNEIKAEREFFAVMLANMLSEYVYAVDGGMSKEECSLRMTKFRETLENYRKANQAYCDWLWKHGRK